MPIINGTTYDVENDPVLVSYIDFIKHGDDVASYIHALHITKDG
jgi:hypothetical protein